jgi:hypothetical protein
MPAMPLPTTTSFSFIIGTSENVREAGVRPRMPLNPARALPIAGAWNKSLIKVDF